MQLAVSGSGRGGMAERGLDGVVLSQSPEYVAPHVTPARPCSALTPLRCARRPVLSPVAACHALPCVAVVSVRSLIY